MVVGVGGYQRTRVFALGHVAEDVVGRFGGRIRGNPIVVVKAMRFDGATHRIILRLRLRDQCPGLPIRLADLDLGHPPVFVVGRDGV